MFEISSSYNALGLKLDKIFVLVMAMIPRPDMYNVSVSNQDICHVTQEVSSNSIKGF